MNKREVTALALEWILRCKSEIEAGDYKESLANTLDVDVLDLDPPEYEEEAPSASVRQRRAHAERLAQRVEEEADRIAQQMYGRVRRLRRKGQGDA